MAKQVYSFRAEPGFVPDGIGTSEYVRNLASGGQVNTNKAGNAVMAFLFTAIPLLVWLGTMYSHNKKLKVQIEKTLNDMKELKKNL